MDNETTNKVLYNYGCRAFKSKLSNNFLKIMQYIDTAIYCKKEIKALPKSNLFLP